MRVDFQIVQWENGHLQTETHITFTTKVPGLKSLMVLRDVKWWVDSIEAVVSLSVAGADMLVFFLWECMCAVLVWLAKTF